MIFDSYTYRQSNVPAGRAKARQTALTIATIIAASLALAACGGSPQKTASAKKNKFSPKKYGVKGSPYKVKKGQNIPKGGGRYMVGKPYKIAGKWYYPKRYKSYDRVGVASWYGPTFHGRSTANGEVFNMHSLSAAHPTMPLPSYARVTNLRNGRSVVVRVNDRGPFHGNRIIDLSKRAADTLEFGGRGTQKVRVTYLGKARIDGQDEQFLAASYRGPGSAQPPAIMVADAGPPPIPENRRYNAYRAPTSVAFDPATSYAQSTRQPVMVAMVSSALNNHRQSGASAPPPAAHDAAARSDRVPEPQPAVGGPLILLKTEETDPRKRRLLPFGTSSYAAARRISAGHAVIETMVNRERARRQIMAMPVVGLTVIRDSVDPGR